MEETLEDTDRNIQLETAQQEHESMDQNLSKTDIKNNKSFEVKGQEMSRLGVEEVQDAKTPDTSIEVKGHEILEVVEVQDAKNADNNITELGTIRNKNANTAITADISTEDRQQKHINNGVKNNDVDNTNSFVKVQERSSISDNVLLNKPHIVNIPMTDEELGIYDDPGDSDGLSDTEIAIAADEKREKTGKVTTFENSKRTTPALGIRKSSRIGAYSKLGTVPSGYRGVANTSATFSEFDDQRSSVTWSARQPMGVFISRKRTKSGSKVKSSNQTSRIASRLGNRSAESR